MKLSQWLLIALMGSSAACGGSTEDSVTSRGAGANADDDDEDEGPPAGSNTTPKPPKTAKPGQGANDDDSDTGGGDTEKKEDICESLPLLVKPKSPEILIVLDRSGSMIQNVDRWGPSANAVKKVTSELTETVKFGLMLFPAPSADMPNDDDDDDDDPFGGIFGGGGGGGGGGPPMASCTPGMIDVPVKLSSAKEISDKLDVSRPDRNGSTPTAATLDAALATLDDPPCPDCEVGPKYVLLVTDGQPTCGAGGFMGTPEDVAATSAAIDKLTAQGIKTYVVGYSIDAAVAPTMDQFAMHGGTERYLPVENEQSLVTELTRITGALVPCEYELAMPIEKPEFVRVRIDGTDYKFGEDWDIDGQKIVLRADAAACLKLRDAKIHDLKITKECKPFMVF
jgi:hypothetical protein